MDRNEKIVIAATSVIALGSAAVFAIKRIKARKNEKVLEEMDEMINTVSDSAPDLR